MKYGEKLVEQSVPKWSLHNVDYNTLKHEIKVHTTRDRTTAMAIPGHQDTRLTKFEDQLYEELCRQHQRVDLFVNTMAGEIIRRLDHLADLIQRLIIRCNHQPGMTVRRQRRLAKYERELLRCGEDIAALSRFVDAQVVAFRKILKKYKKWTGSTALGVRFRENVLRNPMSFTRRDFEHLQMRYDEILRGLDDATPSDPEDEPSPPLSPPSPGRPDAGPRSYPDHRNRPVIVERTSTRSDGIAGHPGPVRFGEQVRYWNEYDDGSEGGADADEYVIYVNDDADADDDDDALPGIGYLAAILALLFEKAKAWFGRSGSDNNADGPDHDRDSFERRPLLRSSHSISGTGSEDVWSGDDIPPPGAARGYGAISHSQHRHRLAENRDNLLVWVAVGCFAAAVVLLVIEAMMLGTGRVEVDAVVAVASVASLFAGGGGVWAGVWLRGEGGAAAAAVSTEAKLVVWTTFVANLLLNALVLGVVVGNMGVYMGFWDAGIGDMLGAGEVVSRTVR